MYEVGEYTHDGHPDVAAQYSQGMFRTKEMVADVEHWQTRTVTALTNEGRGMVLRDPTLSFDVDTDELSVTLKVSRTCDDEQHGEECECWEYVHIRELLEV